MTDLFQKLNPHLHSNALPLDVSCHTYTHSRNRLDAMPEIRQRLQRTFRFKDVMFEETHEVRFPYPVKRTSGYGRPVLDVQYRWCTEYFHFLTEVLPNVLFLYTMYPDAPITCGVSKFTIPLFRWFGVFGDVLPKLPSSVLRVEAPFVECGNPSKLKLDMLRNIVKQKVTFEKTHGILIRRQTTRKIVNDEEVFQSLKTRFPRLTWVVFDDMTIPETAELFSKAAVIVGPHGAGMTNMIFSDSGIHVIECMPIEFPNICYWHMCEMIGNQHTMIPVHILDKDSNMRINIGEFHSRIEWANRIQTVQ